MIDADLRSKLAQYEDMIRALTVKCEELAAENTRLRSEKSDALSVLKEAYNDPAVPSALRIKAAGLALPHETPRLTPQPAPLDLPYEEVEPLAVVVERQRKRVDAMQREARQIRVLSSGQVIELGGNGSDGEGG